MRLKLGFSLWVAFALISVFAGCSGSDDAGHVQPTDAGDSSVLPGDAADGWVDTGPPCGAPSFLGSAMRSSDGVLTNHPEFHFTKMGGVLDVATAYFDMLKTPDFVSLAIYGDVVNNTKIQQCVPYVDQFDVGTQGLTAIVDGPAYELEGSIVTIVCLDPGAHAIFRAIQNDVPPTLLDSPVTLAYSISAYASTPPNRRHPDDPQLVSASPMPGESGWTLRGRMKAGPKEINTLEVLVYIRDPNGLVYDPLRVLPGDLHTIAPRSEFDFETPPAPAEFCSFELFDRFIDGPEAPMIDGGSSDGGGDSSSPSDDGSPDGPTPPGDAPSGD
jgi:hypothetical protein